MPINYYIFLSIALFCIGIVGVLTRRNAIIIFMCIELMLNSVNVMAMPLNIEGRYIFSQMFIGLRSTCFTLLVNDCIMVFPLPFNGAKLAVCDQSFIIFLLIQQ